MFLNFNHNIFCRAVAFMVLILSSNFLFSVDKRDSLKYIKTAEFLMARNHSEIQQYNRNYYSKDTRKRQQYWITLTGEIDRSKKLISPWLNPLFSISSGYYKSEIHKGEFYHIPSDVPYAEYVHRSEDDVFSLTSIVFLPQAGLQARPFLRSKRMKNVAFSFRAGWQFNGVINYSSRRISEETYYNILGLYSNNILYTHRTEFPDMKKRKFTGLYLQWGISNPLLSAKERRFGYRISYSVMPNQHRGFEFSITRRIK